MTFREYCKYYDTVVLHNDVSTLPFTEDSYDASCWIDINSDDLAKFTKEEDDKLAKAITSGVGVRIYSGRACV